MSNTRITPISEIADMPADAPIYFVQGKLIYISQPMSGSNEYGPWKFQSVEIQDSTGAKIGVKLKGRRDGEDIPPAWKGKEVIFENVKTEQGGFKSLTAFDDEHKGKTTRKIKATATCAIYLAGDASRGGNQSHQESAPAPQQQAPAQKPASQAAPRQQPPPQSYHEPEPDHGHDAPQDAVKAMRKLIAANSNTYTLCVGAVFHMISPQWKAITGAEMSEEQFGNAVATQFIQAMREKGGIIMPSSPLPLPKQED